MTFEFIKQKDISEEKLLEISKLKNVHWNYPIEEHIRWMNDNLQVSDIHLLLNEDSKLQGYLSMVDLQIVIDQTKQSFLGIGNVCVDKNLQGNQIGYLLMKLVEYYLVKNKTKGLLICKDNVLPFYKKCGWELFDGKVILDNEVFKNHTFTNEKLICNELLIPRNF